MIRCETENFKSPGVLYNTYNPFADRHATNETETTIGETSIGANTARGPTSKPSRTNKYKKCMIIVGGVMGGLVLLGGVLRLGQRCKNKRATRRRQSSAHIDAERPRLTTRQTAPASLGTAAMSQLAPTGDARHPSAMYSQLIEDALTSPPNPPPYSPLRATGAPPHVEFLEVPSGINSRRSSFFLGNAVDSMVVQTSLAPGFMALNTTEGARSVSARHPQGRRTGSSTVVGRSFQRMMGRKTVPSPVEPAALGEQGHQRTFPLDSSGRVTVAEEL